MREDSKGRLDITVHTAGTIVGTFEMFDAVSEGLFEMYSANPIYWSGKDPAFAALASLPVSFPQVWQLRAWYAYGGGRELGQKLYAKHNLHFMVFTFGGGSLHSTKELTTLEDFQGLLIRAPHGMMADLLTKAGASVVVVPGGEAYTSLEKGVVEAAQFGPPATNYAMGWHEVTDYIIWLAPHYMVQANDVCVNMDAWQALPDDLKAIVERSCRELSVELDMESSVDDYRSVQAMVEYGNEWIQMPDVEIAKFRALAMEVWDEWAAESPETKEIIDSQKDFMRLLGIIE